MMEICSPVFPSGLRGIWLAPVFVIWGGREAAAIWLGKTEEASTVAAETRPACMKLRRSISEFAMDGSLPRHGSIILHLLDVSGVTSGPNQGPSALSNISVTSLCV